MLRRNKNITLNILFNLLQRVIFQLSSIVKHYFKVFILKIIISMGGKESRQGKKIFSADLFELSKQYFQLILHERETNLFKERNQRLEKAVDKYLQNYLKFDKKNLDLLAVDSAHKLHPLDYGTNKVDRQYLINACLRQDDFCRKLQIKLITFEASYQNYLKFLNLIKERPHQTTVPTLAQDFMWHSHMQDPQNYKKDTKKMLGFVLNHNDQIPKQKLKQYWDSALNKRSQIHGKQFKPYQISAKQ